MKQWFCGLLALGLIVGLAGHAKAQPTYNFTTLDVPGTGNSHGFLLDQGSYTTLDVPGSTWTQAYGINASGQIVGWYDYGNGFLLDQGTYTTLDAPNANGINDSGQIVGAYYPTSFLLDHGSYTTIDVPVLPFTSANGINASGQIVG
jgi:uncharacterized membrane protein